MKRNGKTFSLTLGALLGAIGLIFLYGSSLVPSGQWAMAALAGIVNALAVIALGLKGGFTVYAVVGLLGLVLMPDKRNVLLYLLFFGLYPMVKSLLERLKNKIWSWAGKFFFFDLVLCLFVFGLGTLFLPLLPGLLRERTWAVLLAGNVVFLVYDLGFSRLAGIFMARLGEGNHKQEK